jgi:hypothetical protein
MPIVDNAQPPGIVCSVLEEPSGSGVRFRGRVNGPEDMTGTYTFHISKTGPAGSSTINQAGKVAAPANTETFLGSTTLSVEPGASYTVRLTIDVNGAVHTCASSKGDRQ